MHCVKYWSLSIQDALRDKQWLSFSTDIGVHHGNCYLYILVSTNMHEQTYCMYGSRSMLVFSWVVLQVKIFLSRDREANKFGHSLNLFTPSKSLNPLTVT